MLRFTQRFGRNSQAKWHGIGGAGSRVGTDGRNESMTRVRRRNHRLNCETLESRQLLSGYYIVNASSGKVLDDPAFSTSNGAIIQQYQPNGGANQRWNLVALADGNYEVFNAYSGKVLDDPAFSTSNGTLIQQYQLNGGLNQQWKFVALADGNYEVFNAYSGKVLDDPAFSTSNGTQIQQYQLNGGANQQWMLVAAGNAPVVTNYVVNASSGKVLDDPAFSTTNGTQIEQYQLNLGANQRWVFIPLADGNDLVVNASSGKVLDDPVFSTSNGTLIQQYQLNGGLNQQWRIVALADGNDEVFNAFSGKVLDDPAFSTSNGTLIQQYQLNGGLNQQWSISPLANPAASTAYSPAPASAQLFNSGGPSYLDVEQGQVGDCWLLASLAEVAARDPQDIRNMFTYDGTTVDNGATVGLYTVRFFSNGGSAVYVQVDTELPSGGEYYDHVDNALGTQALWVALAEKAYAVANGQGYVTSSNENQDSYGALNNGWPSWALHAITGKPAGDYSINSANLASDWNAGDLIVLCTSNPPSSHIVGEHCYAVVGYNASAGDPFEIFNPWGTQSNGYAPNTNNVIYGLFIANAPFISQNFTTQSIGSGAIKVNNVTEPVSDPTGLATSSGGYARTATIHLTRHNTGGMADAETAGGSRPAQGMATGVDLGAASDAGDGDYPMTSRFRAPRI
jgi:Calpain family cysteine protease/Ricin-type beta-trefoil lectin domain-like